MYLHHNINISSYLSLYNNSLLRTLKNEGKIKMYALFAKVSSVSIQTAIPPLRPFFCIVNKGHHLTGLPSAGAKYSSTPANRAYYKV